MLNSTRARFWALLFVTAVCCVLVSLVEEFLAYEWPDQPGTIHYLLLSCRWFGVLFPLVMLWLSVGQKRLMGGVLSVLLLSLGQSHSEEAEFLLTLSGVRPGDSYAQVRADFAGHHIEEYSTPQLMVLNPAGPREDNNQAIIEFSHGKVRAVQMERDGWK
ncbi:hypothetical protein EON80_04960 [bacterium]|nr:MAG: hypothetical protein EON80_04960 [bacterium]